MHHSSEHYNLSTALRQTWSGGFYSFIFWLWLPLIGFHPGMILLQMSVSLLYQFWIHTEAIDKMPSELSGGMRKRVGLARALALSPKIMLYDEPTTGLDPITTKMVNNLIVETSTNYQDRGMTTVIISHDIRATLEISDYVAFLDRGKIIEYLPVEEFKKSDKEIVQEFLRL